MDYVKGKGYYVGCFGENDIANKLDNNLIEDIANVKSDIENL